ncbi:MAG TPA: glycosyltransferase family 2 protein [Saprospiraceae bacterium]|nr:glycosyltransferase family 2 protein [Saprospiraceae bacterium]HNT19456.1 glycosyltransferase family 2 protein [Saprospiraceae bacterium]
MTISIITPSLNNETVIRDCLESVRTQDYPEIEHLLLDGGSMDRTLEIARSFPHLADILSGADEGIYDAINKGINRAAGEVIAVLNADDFYLQPGVISRVMKSFREGKVDSVYGDLIYVSRKDPSKIIRTWKSGPFQKELFLQGWMPPHPAFFLRKDCYLKYGLYRKELSISADYELMLRMLYLHSLPCDYLPETLVAMRTGGASNRSFKARWLANRQDRAAWTMNGLKPEWLTLWKKPLSKLKQYL